MEVYAKIAQGGNLQNLVWTKVNNDKRVNSKYFESYHLNILTIYIMHIQKKPFQIEYLYKRIHYYEAEKNSQN